MFDEQVQLYKLTNGICYYDLYWIGIFVFDFYTPYTQTFNLIRVFNYQVFMEYLLVFDDLLIFAVWLIFYLWEIEFMQNKLYMYWDRVQDDLL